MTIKPTGRSSRVRVLHPTDVGVEPFFSPTGLEMVIKPTRLGRVWVLHPMDTGVEPFFPSQVCPNLTWLFSAYFYKSNGYRTPET
jgi:hypothetical protein